MGAKVSFCVLLAGPIMLLSGAWSLAAELVDGEELVDPTAPIAGVISAESETRLLDRFQQRSSLTLNSLLVRGEYRVAVINGKRLMEGEEIEGARVLTIARDSVVLDNRGERYELQLYGNSIKTPNIGQGQE